MILLLRKFWLVSYQDAYLSEFPASGCPLILKLLPILHKSTTFEIGNILNKFEHKTNKIQHSELKFKIPNAQSGAQKLPLFNCVNSEGSLLCPIASVVSARWKTWIREQKSMEKSANTIDGKTKLKKFAAK